MLFFMPVTCVSDNFYGIIVYNMTDYTLLDQASSRSAYEGIVTIV